MHACWGTAPVAHAVACIMPMNRSACQPPPLPYADGMSFLVEVRSLNYDYADGRAALREITFSIRHGESVGLIGPNGAGKSTLLLHLNGLLPDGSEPSRQPTGVWLDDRPVAPPHLPYARKTVGLLFQDPDDQLFGTTVLDDVMYGPTSTGMPSAEARRLAAESLVEVGLPTDWDRSPHHLSVGERRRACLAGILACRPRLLALDEPSSHLDPRGRRLLISLLAQRTEARIIATHDLEMVRELCPRVLLLDQGTLHADGPTDQLLADASLMERHGLEVPASLRR